MEVAQLRNVYEKLGRDRFGASDEAAQHRKGGFGIQHDGTTGLGFFLSLSGRGLGANLQDMTAFLASFSSGTFPCVGRQLSFDRDSTTEAWTALGVLIDRVHLGRCDLVAKGRLHGDPVGYVYDPAAGQMRPDSRHRSDAPAMGLIDSMEEHDLLTFTGVPFGSGERLGIDRDRDGCLDGDEAGQQADPAICLR